MRRVKRVIVLILIVMLCMPLLTGVQTEAADGEKHLDVLFTHDTHSHLNSYSTIVNGKQKEVGGFARIKTLIDEKKKENPGRRRFFHGNPDPDSVHNRSGRT